MKVQIILRKMATGRKVIYFIRNILPCFTETRVLLLNSPTSTSSPLFFCFDEWYLAESLNNLEKQLSWACNKACFHRQKYDSWRDFKLEPKN